MGGKGREKKGLTTNLPKKREINDIFEGGGKGNYLQCEEESRKRKEEREPPSILGEKRELNNKHLKGKKRYSRTF